MSVSVQLPPPAKPRTLPWRPVTALLLCNAAHFYSICSIFSYAGIMSADLGWAVDRDHAGTIAGFIQSANVLGRIPTAGLWGCCAARYSARLGLCWSMFFVGVGSLVFGFSTSRDMAIGSRFFLLGMGNGWATLFPPLSIEIAGRELQTKLTGIVFGTGAFIQTFGPALGGWTYGLWPDYPAAIPNLIGALISTIALIAAWMWLPMAPLQEDNPTPTGSDEAAHKPTVFSVIFTMPVPLLVALRGAQGFSNFCFFELVPLWSISSLSLGGLALSERDLGSILTCSGLGTGIFLMFLMSRVSSCLGLRSAVVVSSASVAACYICIPYSPGQITLTCLHTLLNMMMSMCAAVLISCINNATDAGSRAVANGVTVTFESFCKGMGPVGAATTFTWTISHWGLPGHGAVFFSLAFLHMLVLIGASCLPQVVESGTAGGTAEKAEKAKMSPKAAAPMPSLVGAADCEEGAVKLQRRWPRPEQGEIHVSANAEDRKNVKVVSKAKKKGGEEAASLVTHAVARHDDCNEDKICGAEGGGEQEA